MKGFSVKSVCECVLATALTAIFFVISGSSAAFAVFTALFGGVPLVFLAVRYGAAKSGICYAAAVIFVFIVSGCLGRAALNAFILMLPSFAVGYAMRNNFRYYQTMLAAAAAVLFGILLNVIIANAASEYDNAVLHIIDEAAGYAENTMLSYVASLGLEPGEITELISQSVSETKNMILTYFPLLLIIISAVAGYLIVSVCIFFVRRFRVKRYEYVRFYMIKVPKSLSTVAVILMVVSFLSYDDSLLTLSLKNLAAMLAVILAVDGMSVVDFKLREKIRSGYIRTLIYVSALTVGYFMLSIIFYVLMFLGMLDANIDMRMLKRVGGNR